MKRVFIYGMVVAAIIVFATIVGTTFGVLSPFVGRDTSTINLVRTGLVAADPLNNVENQQQLQSNSSYWVFGGDTNVRNAEYNFFEAANQLHIGVASQTKDDWAGVYAASPPTNATLVHAVLTAPSESVSGYYVNGLYAKSADQLLNYLACLVVTTPNGPVWGVVHGYGTDYQTVFITPLWADQTKNQPLTRECTIVTDGANFIHIYLDNQLVYQNDFLGVGLPVKVSPPFNFYIASETQVSGQILYGGYQDFYITLGDQVAVTGAPSKAASVDIVDASGRVYATAPITSGTAKLSVGQYTYPLQAFIKAYSSLTDHSNNTVVASTAMPVGIYGGDVYSFGVQHPSGTATLSLDAKDTGGNDLSGFYVSLAQGRNTLSTDFFPTQFGLNISQTYTITAYDYDQFTFDHWSDGSTSRVKIMSLGSDMSLTAFYRNANILPAAGQTVVKVSAVDPTGKQLSGFAVTVWDRGILSGTSFSPASFKLASGTEYEVAISDYGGYTFSHWSDGSTNRFRFVTGQSGSILSLVAVYTKG